jgi:hypothetical protein
MNCNHLVEQPIEATSTQFNNRDELVSSVHNIIHDHDISALMSSLQDKINKMTKNQQRITMARKIRLLLDIPTIDMKLVKPPPI